MSTNIVQNPTDELFLEIEQLLRAIPDERGKVSVANDSLRRQIASAEDAIVEKERDVQRLVHADRPERAEALRQQITAIRGTIEKLKTQEQHFDPGAYRDAAVTFLAREPEAREAFRVISEEFAELVKLEQRHALGPAEFHRKQAVDEMRTTLSRAMSTAARLRAELLEVIPPAAASIRDRLSQAARALAAMPDLLEIDDEVQRLSAWASNEQIRLLNLVTSGDWESLERFRLLPLT